MMTYMFQNLKHKDDILCAIFFCSEYLVFLIGDRRRL